MARGQALARRTPAATVAIGALIVAYLALRVTLIWRMPVFYDEGVYAAEAQMAFDHPARETLLLAVRENHGPLQSAFALGPMALGFGPLAAIRLLSLLAGACGALAVGLVASALAGRRAGWIASVLWVVLPFSLVYDTLGLGDTVAAASLAGAMCLALRLGRRPAIARGCALGAVIGLGILGKPSAAAGLIAIPLAFVVHDWSGPGRSRDAVRLTAASAIAAVLAGGALLVPHLAPRPMRLAGALARAQQTHALGEALGNFAVLARSNAPAFNDAAVGYFGLAFLILALAGLILALVRRQAAGLLVVSCLLVPAATVYALATLAYPRYLAIAVPALIVLAAVALAAVRPVFAAGLAAVALAQPVLLSARIVADPAGAPYPSLDGPQLVSHWPAGTPWPAVSRVLLTATPAGRRTEVAFHGNPFPPFGLATEIGRPTFPLDVEGRVEADLVYAVRGRRSFVFRRLAPGSRPEFVLEQPDLGGGQSWSGRGYALIGRFPRPRGGPVVTLWRQSRRGRS